MSDGTTQDPNDPRYTDPRFPVDPRYPSSAVLSTDPRYPNDPRYPANRTSATHRAPADSIAAIHSILETNGSVPRATADAIRVHLAALTDAV
jgi:hypothetical protein